MRSKFKTPAICVRTIKTKSNLKLRSAAKASGNQKIERLKPMKYGLTAKNMKNTKFRAFKEYHSKKRKSLPTTLDPPEPRVMVWNWGLGFCVEIELVV